MKFFLSLFGLLFLSTVAVFAFTPAKYSLPSIAQFLADIRDPNASREPDLAKIEAMQSDPSLCYQNTDCTLQKCGTAPSCDSFTVNRHYYKKSLGSGKTVRYRAKQLACPNYDTSTPPACSSQYWLDAYVACETNTCVIKHLLPQPETDTE